MHFTRTTPIVGNRRPVVLARLVIATITAVLALQALTAPTSVAAAGSRNCASVAAKLTKAGDGLLMPSETDAPFTAVTWTGAARRHLSTARLLELTGHQPDTVVDVVDLRTFFRNVAFPQPWHDAQQAREVRRFQRLLRVFERHLTDVRVYRVGTIRIDAYLVGRCGDDLLGLSTLLVET